MLVAMCRRTQFPFRFLVLAFGIHLITVQNGHCQFGGPPVIVLQPADQIMPSGGTAVFTVGVLTSPSSLDYQWRFNGVNIAGATSSVYSRTNVQYTDAGKYSVAITNGVGFAISSNATLTVLFTPLRWVSANFDSSGFKGRLEGPVGANYVISISTDFHQWTPVSTNFAVDGHVDFSDSESRGRSFACYRAKVQ